MKTPFTRRSDAFAEALDHAQAYGAAAPSSIAAGLAPLVLVVERLAAIPQASLPGPAMALREQLVAQAATTAAPGATALAPAAPGASTALPGALAGPTAQLVAGALAVAVAVTGTGVAAHRSGPGDPLHGLRRLVERLQAPHATTTLDEVEPLVDLAASRLDELRRLLAGGPLDASAVAAVDLVLAELGAALDAVFDRLRAAGAVPTDVVEALTRAWNSLAELLPGLPDQAQASALEVLAGLNNRLGALVDGASPISRVPHVPAPTTTPSAGPASTVPSGTPTAVPTDRRPAVPPVVPTRGPLPTADPTGLPTAVPTAGTSAAPTASPSPLLSLVPVPVGELVDLGLGLVAPTGRPEPGPGQTR